jgi:aryl-alcohol dehydrogenase-like predicted oxidoreductase
MTNAPYCIAQSLAGRRGRVEPHDGLAGALGSRDSPLMTEPKTPLVATRLLGATDVRVSEIALGTWGLAAQSYGKIDPAVFEATVRAAWDAGVTTYDVAPLWGQGMGERRLGLALGEHLNEAVIIARVGQSLVEGRVQAQFDAPAILRDVEQTLSRLGRGTLDVLLLHDPPLKVIASEYFQKATGYLLSSGMIQCWGASVGTVEEARLAIEQGAQVLCLVHNLVHRDALAELAPLLTERGVGVLARSPLLYGLLSGGSLSGGAASGEGRRFDLETKFAPDDHRSQRWTPEAWKKRLEEIDRYRFLVGGDVPDLAIGALRYVLSSPLVGAALVGARSPEQIRHAAQASRTPPYLPPDHAAKIAEMSLG